MRAASLDALRGTIRVPYVLRRIPTTRLATLLPCPETPGAGEVALARVESIGKNARLELACGRPCAIHEGDLLAVVFGNRYATRQFEGYARRHGELCDLLSMGGVCGLVESKHASVGVPTRLRVLGAVGDAEGRPLRLGDFALPAVRSATRPRVIVVCGASMDAGKTHTAMSLVIGLRQAHYHVGAIKLTGTAAGRDTWSLLDAGACVALDFIDGGHPSTYLCSLAQLLDLYRLLIGHVVARGAQWVVVEIADGLLQRETAALLREPAFSSTVTAWMFAASDPLAAVGGVKLLHDWGIEPIAVSGLASMSPLCVRETQNATDLPCLTSKELQCGELNARLTRMGITSVREVISAETLPPSGSDESITGSLIPPAGSVDV